MGLPRDTRGLPGALERAAFQAQLPSRETTGGPARLRAGPLCFTALACAFAAVQPARAAEGTPGAPELGSRAQISIGAQRIDYEERTPRGTFLDGETGWLPTLAAGIEMRLGRAFFRAATRLTRGALDYDGRVQAGDGTVNGLPARSTSDARFIGAELQAGGFLDAQHRLLLMGGLGARRWDRDIHSTEVISRTGVLVPVSGLSEVYSWYELQVGLRGTVLARGASNWDLELAVVRTADPRIALDLFGKEVRLRLGARTGFRVGTIFRRDLSPGTFLSLAWHADSYAFGASDFDVASGVFEPDSTTWTVSLEAGAGVRF